MKGIVNRLAESGFLSYDDFLALKYCDDNEDIEYLFSKSREQAKKYYGNKIFIRGLIEFTNHCKNDCLYCGIRASNRKLNRYRLSEEEIIDCCKSGYSLGFRTFVLQGGEDMYFSDDDYVRIISRIKSDYPDCAVTLSIGERSRQSYEKYYNAGADRYLLRHETADKAHYKRLHPEIMSFENRMRCIRD